MRDLPTTFRILHRDGIGDWTVAAQGVVMADGFTDFRAALGWARARAKAIRG